MKYFNVEEFEKFARILAGGAHTLPKNTEQPTEENSVLAAN